MEESPLQLSHSHHLILQYDYCEWVISCGYAWLTHYYKHTFSHYKLYLVLGLTTGVIGKLTGRVAVADRLALDEVSASFVNCCDHQMATVVCYMFITCS